VPKPLPAWELSAKTCTSACRHRYHRWMNWSSGTGCSPLMSVSWEPRALPAGLHKQKGHEDISNFCWYRDLRGPSLQLGNGN
jgi:hypothetical protein